MNNSVTMRIEFDIAAQKAISQVMLTNEKIREQIESAVKAAFENYDFETEVKKATQQAIEKAIKDSSNWGALSKLVYDKAEKIINDHIDKELQSLKDKLTTTNE